MKLKNVKRGKTEICQKYPKILQIWLKLVCSLCVYLHAQLQNELNLKRCENVGKKMVVYVCLKIFKYTYK